MPNTKICPNCAAIREFATEDRLETRDVRGERISLPVRLEICQTCGEALVDEERDEHLLQAYYA